MGKFAGTESKRSKHVLHPFLGKKWVGVYGLEPKSLLAPHNFRLYGNKAEWGKWQKTVEWTKEILREKREHSVIDAFAGIGIHAVFYRAMGFVVFPIEKDRLLAAALLNNLVSHEHKCRLPNLKLKDHHFRDWEGVVWHGDNIPWLAGFSSNRSDIAIADLDAYGSCVPQILEAVRIVQNGNIFITSGDIFAGARFKLWSFTEKRYGIPFRGPKEEFPTRVLFPFVQREAEKLGKAAHLVDHVVFPTIVRMNVIIESK